MTFAEKLGILIQRSGKSQSDVAREAGLTPTTLSQMRLGNRRPYMDQALLIARSLGVSLDFLADNSLDEPHSQANASPDEFMNKDEFSIWQMIKTLGYAESRMRLMDPQFIHLGDRVLRRNKIEVYTINTHLDSPEVVLSLADGREISLTGEDAIKFLRENGDYAGVDAFQRALEEKAAREEAEEAAREEAEDDRLLNEALQAEETPRAGRPKRKN